MRVVIACPLCGSIWELSAEEAMRADYACDKCGTRILTRGDRTKVCAKCGLTYGAGQGDCPRCAKTKDKRQR